MHTANKTGLDSLDLRRSNLIGWISKTFVIKGTLFSDFLSVSFETKSCLQGTRLIQQVLLQK